VLGLLIRTLRDDGYIAIGPRKVGESIQLEVLDSAEDLPRGWGDQQDAGTYRLVRRSDAAYFGFNLGADSWKKWLDPNRKLLWRAKREGESWEVEQAHTQVRRMAFIGVRACELAAIKIQLRVREVSRLQSNSTDTNSSALSAEVSVEAPEEPFLVGLNCSQAAATCFCASVHTGPAFASGCDLVLTEVLNDDDHYFLIQILTKRGARISSQFELQTSIADDLAHIDRQVAQVSDSQSRQLNISNPVDFFSRRLEHSHWDDVAARCLSCANCTLVCPTCFCSTVEDTSDVQNAVAERWSRWDSCFNLDFSFIHGGSLRSSTRSRYRQWLTHKLGTWHEQFGSSGCVGCGRCIAWCPVGIDLTAEVKYLSQATR
jgi:ferredoxin